MKYFLDYETSESPSLNIEHLKDLAYRLKLTFKLEPEEMVVDIPETFNYLLGLKIKVKFRNYDKEDICSYWEKRE